MTHRRLATREKRTFTFFFFYLIAYFSDGPNSILIINFLLYKV